MFTILLLCAKSCSARKGKEIMKKKWLALPVACIMAGMIAAGAGCAPETNSPVVTVQDGYVYVDGIKTEIQVSEDSNAKTAFELWKQDNPDYTGTEAEWLSWLEELLDTEETEVIEHKLIEKGIFKGGVQSGSARTASDSLVMNNAVLRLSESVILPFGESSSWEVNITGKLLTGSAAGTQLFVANPYSEFGRVYLGVNKNSKMLYVGVRMNATYINYGWEIKDASVFGTKHSYAIGYENGIYYLSLDGGQRQTMTHINFNQADQTRLTEPEKDSKNLNELIRTVIAQDYIEMTNIGIKDFVCNCEISDFTVKTSAINGYRRLISHPLAGTKIFYLGSSITYGSASGGVAFGDIVNKITGNPYTKEAVSGTTLVDNGASSYVQRLKKLNFAEKPDFLVVQLSTNDFSQNKPTGNVQSGTQSSDFDTSTISGAIQHIIAYAKEQCPTVKVVFYAGAVRGSWGYKTAYENYMNGDFKRICEKWEIEPLDIFHSDYKNYSFYWSDDIHPTIQGYAAGWTPLFVKYFEKHL